MDGDALPCDVAIFGGGGAGLWLLDVLVSRGVRAVLLEADHLGGGQTGCAQGIIHGGLKYTLDGVLSGSARAIREMPDLWRDCLAGRRSPALTGTRVRAEHCYLWRTASMKSRLGMLGARVGLSTRPQAVDTGDRPAALAACPGAVARIDEPVIDPVSFVTELARRHMDSILKIDAAHGLDLVLDDAGRVAKIMLKPPPPGGGEPQVLAPATVVLVAGAGNARLATMAGVEHAGRQQQRPLHMLMMRGALGQLNGHCVDGARTRVTITSDTDSTGRTVWQVGGQVAEDGVDMEPDELVRHGAAEIKAVLPGVDLSDVEWSTYRIDRAEATAAGGRPDDISVAVEKNVIVAWPTKLALVPRLTERIVAQLTLPQTTPASGHGPVLEGWPRPEITRPPWETQSSWSADV